MAKKHKTIGLNPLTDYLTIKKDNTKKKTQPKDIKAAIEEKALKTRVTIHLPVDLIDKVKNAVYWEPGLTLTEFAEQALARELKRWEKEWGEEYPKRKDYHLKGGRPLK
jgi:hypothetical protein